MGNLPTMNLVQQLFKARPVTHNTHTLYVTCTYCHKYAFYAAVYANNTHE